MEGSETYDNSEGCDSYAPYAPSPSSSSSSEVVSLERSLRGVRQDSLRLMTLEFSRARLRMDPPYRRHRRRHVGILDLFVIEAPDRDNRVDILNMGLMVGFLREWGEIRMVERYRAKMGVRWGCVCETSYRMSSRGAFCDHVMLVLVLQQRRRQEGMRAVG